MLASASYPAVHVDILLFSDWQDVSWFWHFFASSFTDVSAAASTPIHSKWSNIGPLTKPISTVYPEPLPPLYRIHSQAAAGKCRLSNVQEAPSVVLQPNFFLSLILFWHTDIDMEADPPAAQNQQNQADDYMGERLGVVRCTVINLPCSSFLLILIRSSSKLMSGVWIWATSASAVIYYWFML